MKQDSDGPRPTQHPADAEAPLHGLLGAAPRIAEARLRRVREAVFQRIAQPALPPWLRWRVALPAALALLLLGGALGWNVAGRYGEAQGLDLFASALAPDAGEL